MAKRKAPPASPAAPDGEPSEGGDLDGDIEATQRLVNGHLRGDPGASEQLARQIELVVLAALPRQRQWRRLRRRYDPQEVVDELWLRLLHGKVLEKFEWQHKGSLWNEIRTILDRLLVDMNRRMSTVKAGGGVDPLPLEARDPDEARIPHPTARDVTPSVFACSVETREKVQAGLDPRDREVFQLRYDGYTAAEIAAKLGRTRAAVRKVFGLIDRLLRRYQGD